MNPFDLRGPEFLVFYAALGVAVAAVTWFWRRVPVGPWGYSAELTDPYLIACLRGGPDEAVRVATCSLLDRGLVRADGTVLKAVRPDAAYLVERPVERALMKELGKPCESAALFRSPSVVAAASDLETQLIDRGLLADKGRRVAAGLGVILLLGVALIKIVVAFSRGKTNVLYLVILAGLCVFVVVKIGSIRQTIRGLGVLSDLRSLFRGSRALAYTADQHSPDLALLTGVFGLAAAWNHSRSDEFRKLFPTSANEKGVTTAGGTSCGTVWSSCGSSFGTSSCSSGGSSCGGGGCGGGCGGCGGS